jgi:hypothetical protein
LPLLLLLLFLLLLSLCGRTARQPQAMSAMLEIQRLKHRTFVQDPETGRYISLWDLYNYVHHNPQLKALAERGLNTVATSGSPDSR